ncbi:MAG: trigger factor [bacterium]|nr:trigger factor [bacterium]
MKATVEKKEGCVVDLHIHLTREEVNEEYELVYKKLNRTVKVPGFRIGHVPRSILDTRFRERIEKELIESIAPKYYKKAIKEVDIVPLTPPKISAFKCRKDEPLNFSATIEVKPDIELGKYKGIEVEKKVYKVTERDVEKRLKSLQLQYAELVDVEGRGVQKGDTITINFNSFVDGKPIPGLKGENFSLDVGGDVLLPEAEEKIIGAQVGEEREIKIRLPENFKPIEFAGKEATFFVNVLSIKEKRLPVLDDEFARDVGKFSCLSDLKENLREELERAFEMRTNQELRNELLDIIISNSRFEVPRVMLEGEIDLMIRDFSNDIKPQTLSQYLKEVNMSLEELREDFRPYGEKRLKRGLILDSIATKEGIEVTDEELEERIKALGLENVDKAKREDLLEEIRAEKTLRFLLEVSNIKEVEGKREEE